MGNSGSLLSCRVPRARTSQFPNTRRTYWAWPSQVKNCPVGGVGVTVAPRADTPRLKVDRRAMTRSAFRSSQSW